jgi:hypothetical protein
VLLGWLPSRPGWALAMGEGWSITRINAVAFATPTFRAKKRQRLLASVPLAAVSTLGFSTRLRMKLSISGDIDVNWIEANVPASGLTSTTLP